jgi:class 3 adenylate cyclase/tetratricopeptide (TPR) repeat protein
VSTIAEWLVSLGMAEYTERFAESKIDISVLPDLTEQHLKDLGVALGDRLKMLRAIRDLGNVSVATTRHVATTEPTQRADAERRQLTVMFCDLVDSTALSTRLDPEEMREIIAAYHRCCAVQVTKSGGFVARYLGDGVLAYFGYPQAHEDDAEQAVHAGLELVHAVTKIKAAATMALQVRIGIATGLVVVGDLIVEDAPHENEVIGETPNLAARLQALADPNMVVIDRNTRHLLGELFEYRAIDPVCVKGFRDPVSIWQVIGRSAVESRFAALRSTTTQLVGRDEEIGFLLRRWQQTKAGDGCVVLIAGEPGIGKSRLAQTILERLRHEHHTRLRYFCSVCSPHHQNSALYPSLRQVERAAGFRRDDSDEQRLAKLEALLAQGSTDLSEVVPLFAHWLSIPTSNRYPALDLTPEKRKEKTLQVAVAQVEGLAARQPVLMVWEDLQWSDPTTREGLDLMIERVPALRVLMIITFRPEVSAPWAGRPHVTLLSLNRLPPRQSAQMIKRVTGGEALPKEIVDEIVDRTDGVPLFIEELTKAVIESGVLTHSGNSSTTTRPMPPLIIPTSLIASLLARLDRSALMRQVAQIGAALGRQFTHDLISAVAPMPRPSLDDALTQLVNTELVFQRGSPPDAEYTFKHALVQDAAYSTLLHSRRRQLHARITTILESQFPEIVERQPELLSRHCAEAGLVEKAVGYCLKAGRQAIARAAMAEAVAHFQKGLDILANLSESAWRLQQELDLRVALGRARRGVRGYSVPAVGESIVRARALAERLDRPDCLIPLLCSQQIFHTVRGEHKLALSLAEQIEKFGEAQKNEPTMLFGRLLHAFSCRSLGEFVSARALFEQCHGLSDPAHRTFYATLTLDDPHTMRLAFHASTLAQLGYIDQARALTNEALMEAHRLDHAYTTAFMLFAICSAETFIGSHLAAQRHAEELTALSNEHGFSHLLNIGLLAHGWSLTKLGQPREGLTLLTRGLSGLRASGTIWYTPRALCQLAEAYAQVGEPEEGLKCLSEAAQVIEATHERVAEAQLYALWGDLLNAVGDPAGAEQNYKQALAVAQRQSAKLGELIAAANLARLWYDQGKRVEARDLLAPIYGWFTVGFDTPLLQDAKVLLDQLV